MSRNVIGDKRAFCNNKRVEMTKRSYLYAGVRRRSIIVTKHSRSVSKKTLVGLTAAALFTPGCLVSLFSGHGEAKGREKGRGGGGEEQREREGTGLHGWKRE